MRARATMLGVAWLPVGLYAALIWAVSAMSTLPPIRTDFAGSDKVVHAAEFAVLGVLVARALLRTTGAAVEHAWRVGVIALLACAGWGFLDEVHQAAVPGRTSSIWDLLADIAGATLGVLGYVVAVARTSRVRAGAVHPDRS